MCFTTKIFQAYFRAEVLTVAAYIRNLVSSRGISTLTIPYELMFGQKPNLSHIWVFGCRCWFTNCSGTHSKRAKRATETILFRYARGSRAYKLWVPSQHAVVVWRGVHFEKNNSYNLQYSSENNIDDASNKVNMENLLDKPEKSECDQEV